MKSEMEKIIHSVYAYDQAGRLTQLTHSTDPDPPTSGFGPGALAGHAYTYDAAGRVTSRMSLWRTSTSPQFVGTSTYSYDATSQLTGEARDYSVDAQWQYDEAGNRVQYANGNFSRSYTTSALNRIASDGWFTYTHDDEGNITSKASGSVKYEYAWDWRNRLTAVRLYYGSGGANWSLQWTMEYAYDAFDQLVRRSIDTDGPGGYPPVNGFYSHEGGQIVLEFGQYAYGNLTQRWVWGPQTDQLLVSELNSALYGSGEVYYPLADPQQTIHDAAKYIVSAGAVKVVTHRYLDAYGSGGSWSNFEGASYDGGLFMYTGRFIDQLTGLQWHLHRWYDPALGRWLSEDPIGFADDPWNLYRYVGNSLTNAVDPSGLWRFIRRMGSFYVIFNPTAQNVRRAIGIAFKPDAAAFRTRVPLGCKVEARFVQVVKVEVEPRLLEYLLLDHIPGNPRTDVWQLDSKNPPYYPTDNPIFDPYSIVPSWPSMTDEPGIYGFAKANVISFSFDAVTAIVAAKSVGDIRKGDVFGFIRWGYTNRYAGFVGRRAVVSQFTYLNDKTWGPDSFPGFNGLIASTTENWFMDLVLTRWFP